MGPSRRAFLLLLLAVVVVGLPAAASACPFCEGGPSGTNQVREAIFGGGFWFHLAAVGLPFALLLALAFVLHGMPTGRKSPGAKHHQLEGVLHDRTA
jgi:hypothetical protein